MMGWDEHCVQTQETEREKILYEYPYLRRRYRPVSYCHVYRDHPGGSLRREFHASKKEA